MKKILINFLLYLLICSGCVFLIGTFEVVRNDFLFGIVEDNILLENATPMEIYATYTEFKSNTLFTNDYFIYILNFFGILGLFYLLYGSFKDGYESKPLDFSNVFITYGLGWIIIFYIFIILFNYFIEIFVNQVLIILFNDILNQIYIFNLFLNYFIGLFFLAVLLHFFANQIRHFRTIDI